MKNLEMRAAVIGAGFAGIGMSVRLAQAGIEHLVFERAAALGGTWRDNHYPGCACDVPTPLYSFSFALNPEWSRLYAPQAEILAYLERVAEQHGMRDRIRFGHEVCSAAWDESDGHWVLETTGGRFTAEVLVAATGLLAEPAEPEIPAHGLNSFPERTCVRRTCASAPARGPRSPGAVAAPARPAAWSGRGCSTCSA